MSAGVACRSADHAETFDVKHEGEAQPNQPFSDPNVKRPDPYGSERLP